MAPYAYETHLEGFMKDFCWKLAVAAGLILLTCALESSMQAQPAGQDTPSSNQFVPTPAPAQSHEAQMPASGEATVTAVKTFSGRIVKENGEIVLQDPVTKVSRKLSDRSKARKYLDQLVKITGKLDKDTNTIQIESIGPAS